MSNRWKVVRWECPFPTPHHRWEVIEDLGTVEDFHGPFTTHTEAITYADHQARTVAVTLPRSQGKKRIECTTHPSPYQVYAQGVNGYGGVGTVTSPYGNIYFCDAGDMEAVALTLLALARKEKA